ncbi:MAG: ABC transporter ATP-binding protein [Candidatus Lambdaproteobacteria bacterium]|nr:ABC transporter ATP-binding protein [Candidatus Lambdaproteobacteria bacterium]
MCCGSRRCWRPIWARTNRTRCDVLQVRELHVRYGNVRAVQGVSIEVRSGEIVVLIGANGAGKTSMLNAIAGIVRPAAGFISFQGEIITGLPAHRVIDRGIVQVPEGRLIFTGLTVRENLRLGAYRVKERGDPAQAMEQALHNFAELRPRLDEPASALSGGQQQMLAIARGLMARPRLLLLDEPSLGLAPRAVQAVFRLVRTLRGEGITVLLVEQNVRQALQIADRGYVLEGGTVILSGTGRALLAHDLLVSSYLGITQHGKGQS